jgi:hypothetical protein
MTISVAKAEGVAELADDVIRGGEGEGKRDLNDLSTRKSNIGVDGLLNSTIGIVQHEDDVTLVEGPLSELPGYAAALFHLVL